VVAHTCNPSTGKTEAGGLHVEGKSVLHSECEANRGYIRGKTFFQNTKIKPTETKQPPPYPNSIASSFPSYLFNLFKSLPHLWYVLFFSPDAANLSSVSFLFSLEVDHFSASSQGITFGFADHVYRRLTSNSSSCFCFLSSVCLGTFYP
jgi:hypothetical protein